MHQTREIKMFIQDPLDLSGQRIIPIFYFEREPVEEIEEDNLRGADSAQFKICFSARPRESQVPRWEQENSWKDRI